MPLNDVVSLQTQIDAIDQELIALLVQRFEYSRLIGLLKKQGGQPPFDPKRISTQKIQFVRGCLQVGLGRDMSEKLIGVITDQVLAERLEAF